MGAPVNTRPIERLPRDAEHRLIVRIGALLTGSAFKRRSMWPRCVIVLRPEGDTITGRADFANFLFANDLRAAATEALNRKVPPGHVLLWLEADTASVAVAGFQLFNLQAAVRDNHG
jgi:hypothetical protein